MEPSQAHNVAEEGTLVPLAIRNVVTTTSRIPPNDHSWECGFRRRLLVRAEPSQLCGSQLQPLLSPSW